MFSFILLTVMLVACSNSNDAVGLWKPAEGEACLDDIAEFTFTKENTVRILTGDGLTIGGKYEQLDKDLYSVTFNNGIVIDGKISKIGDTLFFDLADNEGDRCQFRKIK